MRLSIKKKMSGALKSRVKKRVKIRKRVFGTPQRPRLCIYKSSKNIYAQLIDDASGTTLASASSLADKVTGPGREVAQAVGKLVAERALKKNLDKIVFDRSGYVYHGRVKALADGAREAGLKF